MSGMLYSAFGLALDPYKALWVQSLNTAQLSRIPDGSTIEDLHLDLTAFQCSIGGSIYCDQQGRLYVSCLDKILVFDNAKNMMNNTDGPTRIIVPLEQNSAIFGLYVDEPSNRTEGGPTTKQAQSTRTGTTTKSENGGGKPIVPSSTEINKDGNSNVKLEDSAGNQVASVKIGAGTFDGTGTVYFRNPSESVASVLKSSGEVVSTIISITTSDGQQPKSGVEICFVTESNNTKSTQTKEGCKTVTTKPCLASVQDGESKWECQDGSLEESQVSQNSSLVELCGVATHFTSFALVLSPSESKDSGCESEKIYFWLSMGFLCGALLVFIVSITVHHLVRLHKRRSLQSKLKDMRTTMAVQERI
eukprot:TRINITY_DN318_c0_g1_i6.p1 TRINITY_DN318_c0_g1~~TRINITY_DN318_c0_g1_i6.p1  ORF type:complete len:361 (-),score=43.66 TRINITY_DN318_c0_g1_i6:17-1099(-)